MSKNIDQFAIYSAKIFDLLYESFPIPISIDQNEVISEFLNFKQNDELEKLKNKRNIADLIDIIPNNEEKKRKTKEKLPDIEERIFELEEAQLNDKEHHESIYEGTLEFLLFEELLRKSDYGKYQLTSKGFLHLNKKFNGGTISEENGSNISVIRKIFEKSTNMPLNVATGVLINVVSRIL